MDEDFPNIEVQSLDGQSSLISHASAAYCDQMIRVYGGQVLERPEESASYWIHDDTGQFNQLGTLLVAESRDVFVFRATE